MKRIPTVVTAVSASAVVAAGILVGGSAASAGNATNSHTPIGRFDSVARTARLFTVVGWAADPDAPKTADLVQVTIDGHAAARFHTRLARPVIAHDHHVGPNSGFIQTIPVSAATHTICVQAGNIGPGALTSLGCFTMNTAGKFVAPKPVVSRNAAIAALASKYVGHPYVEGAAGPTAFDCSGLVQYVYAHAAHISLPHNAQAQYNIARPIPAAQVRAGDLVFFHSGGGVYHVGIYAGPNRMWAAATPRDGVRYQSIWSSAVSYGTVTH
jgi:cell wall-associated NlpC family hydrolase